MSTVVRFSCPETIFDNFDRKPGQQWTTHYCPGCGLQRATYHILHGELAAAFSVNVLSFFLVPLFLVFLFSWFRSLDAKEKRQWDVPFPVTAISTAVIMLFWILRNIPVWPYSFLAP